jgi:putative GTP pyrophosphokinase
LVFSIKEITLASHDYEKEKDEFRSFYDQNALLLEGAKLSFVAIVNALVTHAGSIEIAKVDGRIKDKEECIRKFSRKYRPILEEKNEAYDIRSHITDLIGLRVVCLYEDEIEKVSEVLNLKQA